MSTVDEVKARLDIVDVVGGYVRLQKAGRYFKANCPFHTERTPSFVVYPDRQSWHCFGACGVGGDVISFVSRKENLDFQGALRLLADRAGVELRDDGPRRETVKTLQDANEAAALYFHGLLQNASDAAGSSGAARQYAEERGLDRQAIADFQLGYAPSGWDHLRSHLLSRGFDEQKLIDAGLLIAREDGAPGRTSYDRFRERLMFPIRDDRGRVVGFGGRILPGSGIEGNNPPPKYMNTPQTPIFDKGNILYGLDRAKDEIRRNASSVIVEGYMDVIAAHQHGFKNVVASMGTALTDRQALLLQRFGERIVLAMDADEAGSAANLRGVLVVKAAAERSRPTTPRAGEQGTSRGSRNLDLRVLTLPQGKDPDELIRSDPAAWSGAIESAKPVVEHLFAVMTAGRDLSLPETRSTLVGEVLPTIGEIADPVVQAHYLQRLSRLARISEDSLRRQLPRRGRPEGARGGRNGFERRSPEAVTMEQLTSKVRRAPREEFCLALIFKAPELAETARTAIRDELFAMSVNFELLRRWKSGETVTDADAELWEHYQTVLQTSTPQIEMGKAQEALLSCVAGLENDRIRAVKEASALALVEGEAGVRPGYVASIAREWLEAGRTESGESDGPEGAVASLLLEDTKVGLQLHAPSEGARSDQTTTTTGPLQ